MDTKYKEDEEEAAWAEAYIPSGTAAEATLAKQDLDRGTLIHNNLAQGQEGLGVKEEECGGEEKAGERA